MFKRQGLISVSLQGAEVESRLSDLALATMDVGATDFEQDVSPDGGMLKVLPISLKPSPVG
jgi:hypothetical protein